MKCRVCGEARDSRLKHCSSCGSRQISVVGAVDLYLILWFVILLMVYLVESVIGPSGRAADFLWIANYLIIAGVDAIVVITIYLYGGRIADRLGRAML
ncbi:MAG TPA: hypothetical protein VGK23_12190 [Methanomassiliicoccales archaeon]